MTRLTLSMALAVAAAVAGPAGLAGCEKKAPESAQEQARSVSVVAVAPREIEGGLTASGGLLPREEVAIFPQINGYRVVSVSADEGSTVRAGQVLATMDDTLLKAQVAQQSALLEEQKVAAKRADAEAARVKGMMRPASWPRNRSRPAASAPIRPTPRSAPPRPPSTTSTPATPC